MTIVPYTKARANLVALMDEACDSRAPVVITRQNRRPVVMLALEEWESLQETLHLLGSPSNAARLMESIAQAEGGELAPHEPMT
jgi:antitoxin YefM